MHTLAKTLSLVTLLLLGVLAGFFFSFSFVVMPGFDQTEPVSAIEAMQGINRAVRNPVFFVPFFLTSVFAFLAGATALLAGARRAALYVTAAGICYLIGGMALTIGYHIPLNEALALVDAKELGEPSLKIWARYSQEWTPMNTVRTFVCLAAIIPVAFAFGELYRQETKA